MSATELARLLDAQGVIETTLNPTWERQAWDAAIESRDWQVRTCKGAFATWQALAVRDLLTWFDAEGQFFQDGEHAKLLRYVLRPVDPDVDVQDRWVDGSGLLLQAAGLRFLQPGDRRSDYLELGLILLAASRVAEALGSPLRAWSLATDDQSVALAMMPREVADEAQRGSLLDIVMDDWPRPPPRELRAGEGPT